MAGSRPSSFKKSGGFLNNVQGIIANYEFTTEFPGSDGEKSGKSDFNPLYCVLTAQVDGSDDPQTTTLFVGSADDFEIEENGHVLTPVDDSVQLRAGSDFARFIGSLCEAGFPESSLPDDGEPINYEAIIGTRVTFVQLKDEEKMARSAKNAAKSKGKFNAEGQRKGKDGKYYNQTYLAVSEVLALPGTGDAKASKATGKATKPAAAGKASKPAKEEVDIDAIAIETLIAVVTDADGKLHKSKLPVKLQQKLGAKHPQREEVRKLVYTDEFLAREEGWNYDAKKQTITVEAD